MPIDRGMRMEVVYKSEEEVREQYLISLRLEMAFGITGLQYYFERGEKKYLGCFDDIKAKLETNKNQRGYAFPPLKDILPNEELRKYVTERFEEIFQVVEAIKNDEIDKERLKKVIEDSEELYKTLSDPAHRPDVLYYI